MNDKDWEKVEDMIEKAVDRTVNGKLDRIYKLIQGHMVESQDALNTYEEVKPFLQGWNGARRIGNVIKWVAGLIIAIGGAIAILMNMN